MKAEILSVGTELLLGEIVDTNAAYLAQQYNSINDLLQLVFSFVNAPLFGTFLLGMFWKRATGHGAFFGLLSGTCAAALTHGLTLAEGKGGWLATLHEFPSSMSGVRGEVQLWLLHSRCKWERVDHFHDPV